MTAYEDLMAYQRDTELLAQISGRLSWDQEAMMPKGAAPQRAQECAVLEALLHTRRTAPEVAEWLDVIDDSALEPAAQAQMRLIRRRFTRDSKLPQALVAELARVTSQAQGQWAIARRKEDVAAFLPVLEQILRLKREEAQALAETGDLYDALLDDYEPGMTGEEVAQVFSAMRPDLVDLRAAILEKPALAPLTGSFETGAQVALATQLAQRFGYDLNHGRVDKVVHPFCSGSGLDVRITTRAVANDPFNCLYSTLHETGHGCYEQNIDRAYLATPLGRGVSMGVHESQSRIYENQLGRSRAFTAFLFGEMRRTFGDLNLPDAEAFYGAVNQVSQTFIRTEADEVQYNLHIMLRFDLERALISGDLLVADLEAAWNDRFEADFGYGVDRPSNGCLQDVHWSVGLFGYFPTYSLGNVYAGCLYEAMRAALPGLDADLAQGDLGPATDWLKTNVQTHGGLYPPKTLIEKASGTGLSVAPLMQYLKAKYGDLYGL